MARRKIVKTPVGAYDVESRPLITLYDGDSVKGSLDGALVRYYPEARLTSIEVERRVPQIRNAGAAAVRVQAKQRDLEGVQVASPTELRGSVEAPGARRDARKVVTQLADDMKNV